MPVIKARPNRIRSVRHISRLQEPNRDALLMYARFIGDTPDYILNQMIEQTLLKDRDFIAWRAEQPPGGTRDESATGPKSPSVTSDATST